MSQGKTKLKENKKKMKGNKNGTQFDSSSLTISAQKTQLQVILNQFITEIHTKVKDLFFSFFFLKKKI